MRVRLNGLGLDAAQQMDPLVSVPVLWVDGQCRCVNFPGQQARQIQTVIRKLRFLGHQNDVSLRRRGADGFHR